ncbi:MAG: tRNA (adenosine(37)-N6)-threonylcarbamoyltransferase complex dimerization subunit type 1 TsaB [Prolixibacteraceae bacterium]
MFYILNLESSTEVCSVALTKNGVLYDLMENAEGMNHARLMGAYVQEIINRNKLNFDMLSAVAVSMGPGSYTGLRIGVSLAKGICYANAIPLIAVSPLQAMSSFIIENKSRWNLPDSGEAAFCPMIDARRMEVYMALYDINNQELEGVSTKIVNENSFQELLEQQTVVFFGNGSDKLNKLITHKNAVFVPNIKTSAQFMCSLANRAFENKQFVDLAYFEPFYLKDFIAGVPKKTF